MVQTRVVLSGTGAEMAASPVGVSAATGPAGAVDDVALLVAAREARLFAGEACVFRARVAAGGDAAEREQEAGRLLAAADKVDLETPGVRAAVEAEVVVSGAGRGVATDAAAFIDAVRSDAQRQLGSRVETESRGWARRAGAGHGGVSM